MTREKAIEILKQKIRRVHPYYGPAYDMAIKALEQESKTGRWIEIAKYSDGKHEIECSECGSHIFDRGHANSYVVKERYKYCPRCGCCMFEPQEESEE